MRERPREGRKGRGGRGEERRGEERKGTHACPICRFDRPTTEGGRGKNEEEAAAIALPSRCLPSAKYVVFKNESRERLNFNVNLSDN